MPQNTPYTSSSNPVGATATPRANHVNPYDVNNHGARVDHALVADSCALASSVEWANVLNTPSTFAPSAHTHPLGEVSGTTVGKTRLVTTDSAGAAGELIAEQHATMEYDASGTTLYTIKNERLGTSDPTVSNDLLSGWSLGSRWFNIATAKEFVCLDNAAGAAVWKETTAGAGTVTSVFGRSGVVTAATSDYDDVQIDNTSTVVGATVKAALDQLDSDIANAANWDTAYGWGDHSVAGYTTGGLTSADIDTLAELNAIVADATIIGEDTTNTVTNKTLNDFTNDIHADDVHLEVRNESGVTINKGEVVYVSGYSVGQSKTLVSKADASSTATMPALGIANESIANNAEGEVIKHGKVSGIDTSSFSAGDIVYVSETAGAVTSTKPTGTALVEEVGEVLRSHASLGVVEVNLAPVPYVTGFIATLLDDGTAAAARTTIGAGTMNDLIDDTSPQLGAYLDTNLNQIRFNDNYGIDDNSGNAVVRFRKTGTAINHLAIWNAATGGDVELHTEGTDATINFKLDAKGSGEVILPSTGGIRANVFAGYADATDYIDMSVANTMDFALGGSVEMTLDGITGLDLQNVGIVVQTADIEASAGTIKGTDFEHLDIGGGTAGDLLLYWNSGDGTLEESSLDPSAVVTLTGAETLTNKTVTNPAHTDQTVTDAATVNWNCDSGGIGTVTLAGNRTIAAPTNLKKGTYILHVKQDATGSRTVTWNAVFKWPGGTAPTLSTAASAHDIITFVCDGTNLYGVASLAFS